MILDLKINEFEGPLDLLLHLIKNTIPNALKRMLVDGYMWEILKPFQTAPTMIESKK